MEKSSFTAETGLLHPSCQKLTEFSLTRNMLKHILVDDRNKVGLLSLVTKQLLGNVFKTFQYRWI